MLSLSRDGIKIFVVCLLIIVGATLFFIPPSQYNAFLWDYLHETAPIYWIGQGLWLFLGAFIMAGCYVVTRRLT